MSQQPRLSAQFEDQTFGDHVTEALRGMFDSLGPLSAGQTIDLNVPPVVIETWDFIEAAPAGPDSCEVQAEDEIARIRQRARSG